MLVALASCCGNADETGSLESTDASTGGGGAKTTEPGKDSGSAAATGVDAAPPVKGLPWDSPQCDVVFGMGGVTISMDEGRTVARTPPIITPGHTHGLAALTTPNNLVAHHREEFWLSEDSGCNWRLIGESSYHPVALVAGAEGYAYGYGINAPDLYRIVSGTLTPLNSPLTNHYGLGTDPEDPRHLRIAGNGRIYDSKDAGVTWTLLVEGRGEFDMAYGVAFGPKNLDHILLGSVRQGVSVSFSGGAYWEVAAGLVTEEGPVVPFTIAISPADHNVVWLLASALHVVNGYRKHERGIYRSQDGGYNFALAFGPDEDARLNNSSAVVPHPTQADVVYAVGNFTQFADGGALPLYRYAHGSRELETIKLKMPHTETIAFPPGHAEVMYLALSQQGLIP